MNIDVAKISKKYLEDLLFSRFENFRVGNLIYTTRIGSINEFDENGRVIKYSDIGRNKYLDTNYWYPSSNMIYNEETRERINLRIYKNRKESWFRNSHIFNIKYNPKYGIFLLLRECNRDGIVLYRLDHHEFVLGWLCSQFPTEHIVKTLDYKINYYGSGIIMERMDCNLEHFNLLSNNDSVTYLFCILFSLALIHKSNIIYGGVKSTNIMFVRNKYTEKYFRYTVFGRVFIMRATPYIVKLGDFRMSNKLSNPRILSISNREVRENDGKLVDVCKLFCCFVSYLIRNGVKCEDGKLDVPFWDKFMCGIIGYIIHNDDDVIYDVINSIYNYRISIYRCMKNAIDILPFFDVYAVKHRILERDVRDMGSITTG